MTYLRYVVKQQTPKGLIAVAAFYYRMDAEDWIYNYTKKWKEKNLPHYPAYVVELP